MAGLDTFKLNPRGNVEITLSWAPTRVEFMSGKSQFMRRRIHAQKSYSFTVSGTRKDMDWLIQFYNDHRGQFDPFYFEYDGNKEVVYFGEALKVKAKREVGVIVGFEATLSLELDSRQGLVTYHASESDTLPEATAPVTYMSDWNTKVDSQNATARRMEYTAPRQKLSVKFRGLKKDRDKIMRIYESHEMKPCLFPLDGKLVKVRLPESVTFIDYREIKQIVGYSCEMDLEMV